jgi:hypothetical protein
MAAHFGTKRGGAVHFEGAHAEIVAAQGAGPQLGVVALREQRTLAISVGCVRGKLAFRGPHFGLAALDAPEAGTNNVWLAHRREDDLLREIARREAALH